MSDPQPPRPDLEATRLASPANPGDATRVAGAPAPPAEEAAAPVKLGGYRLLKRIGGGGMGQIFLAVQETLGRHVAIKILPQGALADPDAVARFRREVEVLAQLQHRNICPVLEAATEGGTHYYVMELLRGMDLARVLRTQRVDTRRAAAVALQVARALQCAHERGIVHRDVKPSNVMLSRGEKPRHSKGPAATSASRPTPRLSGVFGRLFSRGGASPPGQAELPAPEAEPPADPKAPSPEWEDHAVLIDFGLAREGGADAAGSNLTVTGAVVGTPAYMAPEQARGDRRAISAATDVYSLGATLYEMLTLRAPFSGETVGAVLQQVMHADPVPPRGLNPFVDRDLETIVLKAMEKEPARRYAAAGELAADLEAWLAGEAIRARPASAAYRLRKRIARNPLAAAALAAAAALLGVGLWLGFGPGTIELPLREDGEIVSVDGEVVEGREARVMPGMHVVEFVRRDHEKKVEQVRVDARARVSVRPELKPLHGWLAVTTEPPGAEVWCDGEALGRTPLRARVRYGRRELRLKRGDYEEERDILVEVQPGGEKSVERRLRHEKGALTVDSDPPELRLTLVPAAGGREIVTGTPAERFPLDTGRYRVRAQARNYFPREFDLEVRAGEERTLRVSLNSMAQWHHTMESGAGSWLVTDLNGDANLDLVVSSPTPPRLRALEGKTGAMLWFTEVPPLPFYVGLSFGAADLDGDLRQEVVYGAPGTGVVVLDGASGRQMRTLPAADLKAAILLGDHDGDGLTDILCGVTGGLRVVRGSDGGVLWTLEATLGEGTLAGHFDRDPAPDVVVRSADGSLVAVEGRAGRILWKVPAAGAELSAALDLDGDGADDVLMHIPDRGLMALSGSSGGELWSRAVEGGSGAQLAVGDLEHDGRIEILQPRWDSMAVIEGATGRTLRTLDGRFFRSPPTLLDVTGDGRDEILTQDLDRLTALDAGTLTEIWTFEADGGFTLAPCPGDFNGDGRQDLIVRSLSGMTTMLAAADLPVAWRQRGPHMHTEHPEIIPAEVPKVFVLGQPHGVMNAADGLLIRSHLGENFFYSAPANVEGRLRIAADGEKVGLLDPETLLHVWSLPRARGFSDPFVADLNGDGSDDIVAGDQQRGPPLEAFDGRNGNLLWQAPLARTLSGRMVLCGGRLWVPAPDGVHGLDPATGDETFLFPTNGAANSLAAAGDDVVLSTRRGRVARLRLPGGRSRPELVWSVETGITLNRASPECSGTAVAVLGFGGAAILLDAETGERIWKGAADVQFHGRPSLRDLDADGRPEVAAIGFEGAAVVFDGARGQVAWRIQLPANSGWAAATWFDLEPDGTPELLVPCRDGRLYALRPTLKAAIPSVSTGPWPRAGEPAARADRQAAARTRALQARAAGQWEEAIREGREGGSAETAWVAALAAHRLGDAAAVHELAGLARRLGCRRLDLELVALSYAPEGTRDRALADALCTLPPTALTPLPPDPALLEFARRGAALAAPQVSAAGDWERAVPLFGIAGDLAAAAEAARGAGDAGADPGRVALALGRAAFAAGDLNEARAALRRAAERSSAAAEAATELRRVDSARDDALRTAAARIRAGAIAEGLPAAERAAALSQDDAEVLGFLAALVADAPGVTPAQAERAIPWAARAVELARTADSEANPRITGYLQALASAHYAAGHRQEAVRLLREAVSRARIEGERIELQRQIEQYEAGPGR